MKKIIFGVAAALLSVVGLSAFKKPQKNNVSLYWFFTADSPTLTVTSFDQFATAGSDNCTGGWDYCEVGYTIGQVVTSAGVVTSVKDGQTIHFRAFELQL